MELGTWRLHYSCPLAVARNGVRVLSRECSEAGPDVVSSQNSPVMTGPTLFPWASDTKPAAWLKVLTGCRPV